MSYVTIFLIGLGLFCLSFVMGHWAGRLDTNCAWRQRLIKCGLGYWITSRDGKNKIKFHIHGEEG